MSVPTPWRIAIWTAFSTTFFVLMGTACLGTVLSVMGKSFTTSDWAGVVQSLAMLGFAFALAMVTLDARAAERRSSRPASVSQGG
jgi:hypothetical protein